jgi:hypothetical protein
LGGMVGYDGLIKGLKPYHKDGGRNVLLTAILLDLRLRTNKKFISITASVDL